MRGEDRQFFPYDGRNLNPELADLSGEAVGLRIDPDAHLKDAPPGARPTPDPKGADPKTRDQKTVAHMAVAPTAVLKAPRWEWQVPAYLALGGIGGMSATLALTVRLTNGDDALPLERAAHVISGVATAAGAGLLVLDLGRPSRFYNMLRVFRPSSPMNVGAWVLAASRARRGCRSWRTPHLRWCHRGLDLAGRVGLASGVVSGLLGLPLAGYTGVLLGSTANPAWHEVRRELPGLFLASATSAGSGMVTLAPRVGRLRRSAEVFGILGRAADLLMARRVKTRLAPYPATTASWEHGEAGRLDRMANAGTAAALGLGVVGLRYRWARLLAAVLAVLASFAQRFAVFEAGKAAAADPNTVYETQTRRPQTAQLHADGTDRTRADGTDRPRVEATERDGTASI
ncbi:MAG: polysulfide reductase NrfD [Acidimicrobiia bacterium]|nr:polysulfide reductase NrfD [Acidimicrobiia bacterium]